MAFPVDWGRKCALTIQSSKVDADLSDWTYVLTEETLPSEMFDADGSYPAIDGGGDIRFSSDADGSTRLPCDIREFSTDNDPANGTADITVKVPSVSSSSNTTIYVWYAKSGETQPTTSDTYGQHNSYDSSYAVVLSLNEDPGPGNSGDMKDRTSNARHYTAGSPLLTADRVDAKVFKGVDLQDEAGSSVGAVSTLNMDATTTAELIFKVNSLSNFDAFIDGTSPFTMLTYGAELRTNAWTVSTSLGLSTGVWYHAAMALEATDTKLYLNGSTFSYGISPAAPGARTITLGEDLGSSGRTVDGIIDEFRLSSVTRTAAWINADYQNLINSTAFTTTGTPETPSGESISECTSESESDSTSESSSISESTSESESESTSDSSSISESTSESESESTSESESESTSESGSISESISESESESTSESATGGSTSESESDSTSESISESSTTSESTSESSSESESPSTSGLVYGEVSIAASVAGTITMPRQLNIGADNNVIIKGVADDYDGTYLNAATTTFSVSDVDGAVIATNEAMPYKAGTNGVYHGVLQSDDAANLVDGVKYNVDVTIVSGQYNGFRRVAVVAGYHGFE